MIDYLLPGERSCHSWFRWVCSVGMILALGHGSASVQSAEDLRLLPPLGSGDSITTTDEVIPPEATVLPEPAPIDTIISSEQVASGAAWIPTKWFAGPIWEYGAEVGINGSQGNAEAFSVLAGANAKRVTEGSIIEWNLKYGKTETGGRETQHFALFNSRWDLNLNPIWFIYSKNSIEYDEFKAFDVRVAPTAGLGRHLIKSEITQLTGRLGAGVSREYGGPDDSYVPEGNVGFDFEHQLTERQRVKLTTDYYPSWNDFRDYRLVTDAFWEISLDGAAGLSLKLGAVDRYDSTPNGRQHNDIDYFVTLIWKR